MLFHINFRFGDLEKLGDMARRIVRELDILTADSVDAKLDKPADWRFVLTEVQLARMTEIWRPLKQELIQACKAAIVASGDAAMGEARELLASVLERVYQEIRPHNQSVLKAMAAKLLEIVEWPELAAEPEPAPRASAVSGVGVS
jgi:hypothetical protein